MKKIKGLLGLMSVLLLTGCDFLSSSSVDDSASLSSNDTSALSSEISLNQPSSESSEDTTSDILSSIISSSENSEDTTSDVLSSIISSSEGSGSSSEEPSTLVPADLTTFATDKIMDEVVSYTDADYIVKDAYNGFTYPSDAQVQPTKAYAEFWHPETVLNMRIVASVQVFEWIQQYGVSEQRYADLYFPVTVEIVMNTKRFVYYEVGMRIKGNTSRTEFIENGKFFHSLSFKLSFNELWDGDEYAFLGLQKTWTKKDAAFVARDDRTIMGDIDRLKGLKKIDIKWNKSEDSSLIMQPYVFSFFQKYGSISQNSTLTTLKLNNTKMGIVTINEPVDKHLLRRYFPKAAAAGNLYKVGWGYNSMGNLSYEKYLSNNLIIGEEDKFTDYTPIYDAKEFNDSLENPHASLVNLMKVLKDNAGKSVSQYTSALEAVVDMNSFLNYAALSYLTGNPDDMRNNGNNYYIFFNPSENNKAYFLPYDYDWSLNLTWSNDLSMLNLSPFSTKHKGNSDSWQSNRLYWYTICTPTSGQNMNITLNTAYQNTYGSILKDYIGQSYYSVTNYNTLFNTYKTTYNGLTASDLDKGNNKISAFAGTSKMTEFIANMISTVNSYIN